MVAQSPISNIFLNKLIGAVWTFGHEGGRPSVGVRFDDTGFIANADYPEQYMWRLAGASLEIFDRNGAVILASSERYMEGDVLCILLRSTADANMRFILREAGDKPDQLNIPQTPLVATEKYAEKIPRKIEAPMAHAALTYVYNENVNLPIWINYYGKLFAFENLFVIDRESDDGSTKNLGPVNVIRVPRTKFDDGDKSHALSSFHSGLLRSYNAVVCTDCDEILIPDPAKYTDLNDYIARAVTDYATGMGLNLVHAIDREPPLDLAIPILQQRKYAAFTSTECKTLVSRVPLTWAPGLHCTKLPPKFDTDLFVFHLKIMDYTIAVTRQKINQDTSWSQRSIESHHGVHHRFDLKQFITQTFLANVQLLNSNNVFEFQFADMLEQLNNRVAISDTGFYEIPFGLSKTVVIPERFADLL